jgi:hypothetical protein
MTEYGLHSGLYKIQVASRSDGRITDKSGSTRAPNLPGVKPCDVAALQ